MWGAFMRVLVTGANGFIGKNLCLHLKEQGHQVHEFSRGQTQPSLLHLLGSSDAVIHLAGENRPQTEEGFVEVNVNFTQALCNGVLGLNEKIPIIFASSIQVAAVGPYGASKLIAESILTKLWKDNGNPICIYRLPNVFGKWSKPNYNSVVATFCYNMANNKPITINNSDTLLNLVYIDDVVAEFEQALFSKKKAVILKKISNQYQITLGNLASQIETFANSREGLYSDAVGVGLKRALHATYLSFISAEKFAYTVPAHQDARGKFVEILKTASNGQFSFFTAKPGVTRGGHYHHSKTEKFLVVSGKAVFRFKNILTHEYYEIEVEGGHNKVIETVPGWAHDVTNIGDEELFCMLWANEIFDRNAPDTFAFQLDQN